MRPRGAVIAMLSRRRTNSSGLLRVTGRYQPVFIRFVCFVGGNGMYDGKKMSSAKERIEPWCCFVYEMLYKTHTRGTSLGARKVAKSIVRKYYPPKTPLSSHVRANIYTANLLLLPKPFPSPPPHSSLNHCHDP